jgi:hypothetical protein
LTSDDSLGRIGLLGSITLLERVYIMHVYRFEVAVASEVLDHEVVEQTISSALADALPDETPVVVKAQGIKDYSEQGWKVARSRIFGISVKDAGDGHKAKTSKIEEVEAVA